MTLFADAPGRPAELARRDARSRAFDFCRVRAAERQAQYILAQQGARFEKTSASAVARGVFVGQRDDLIRARTQNIFIPEPAKVNCLLRGARIFRLERVRRSAVRYPAVERGRIYAVERSGIG